ncbi:hypothetical protein GW537_14095 [Piscirickettsia salmonis]|uniref:patatin-like phospholipase family protein n=1 Tax=Piscirickettsia salmonis TaxID=1238 RepID=UPI00137BDDF2|nr:patatin-like phospholipase family protein [Piscirickettsia salmonis]QHS30007.1 hypothetical protein GW537_14095 [Piscirickettsia salmonis]
MTYKYIAFMGGGARGIVYPGAYKSLVDSGLYKNIEGIAGSSIGAISSAIMASGATPEQFKKIFDHTNFSKLVSKDGQLFLNFFKERIKDNILYFFKEHKISTEQDFNTNKEFLKNKDQLKEIFIKCKKNKSITFKDLNILHKIDPTLFKNLSVNAVVKNTGKNKIFNHKNTPNIEISRACLASGALPGIFNPVTIDNCEYVDGGVYENLPASPEYFSDNKNKQVSQNEILMMTLARKKGPMHTAIHSNPNETKNYILKRAKTNTSKILAWIN